MPQHDSRDGHLSLRGNLVSLVFSLLSDHPALSYMALSLQRALSMHLSDHHLLLGQASYNQRHSLAVSCTLLFHSHSTYFSSCQVPPSTKPWGAGVNSRERRMFCHRMESAGSSCSPYSFSSLETIYSVQGDPTCKCGRKTAVFQLMRNGRRRLTSGWKGDTSGRSMH